MGTEIQVIKVMPGSELDRLIDELGGETALLERNGSYYRLEHEWTPVSDEEYLRILDETVGSWADIDTDRLIEDIYRWRREGSRYPIDP